MDGGDTDAPACRGDQGRDEEWDGVFVLECGGAGGDEVYVEMPVMRGLVGKFNGMVRSTWRYGKMENLPEGQDEVNHAENDGGRGRGGVEVEVDVFVVV